MLFEVNDGAGFSMARVLTTDDLVPRTADYQLQLRILKCSPLIAGVSSELVDHHGLYPTNEQCIYSLVLKIVEKVAFTLTFM